MEINEVLIKFKNTDNDKIDVSWNLNPDTKIIDLFNAFDSAKKALIQFSNEAARKKGIKSEKAFYKWLENKSIRDIS